MPQISAGERALFEVLLGLGPTSPLANPKNMTCERKVSGIFQGYTGIRVPYTGLTTLFDDDSGAVRITGRAKRESGGPCVLVSPTNQ